MLSGFTLALCLLWMFVGCIAYYQCPPKEDIVPCTCNQTSWSRAIKCRNVTDDSLCTIFDKSGDIPFKQLEISNSTLMHLPEAALKKKKIWNLSIDNCTIASIFESQPDPSDNLRRLWLKDTRFLREIEWDFFSSFPNLNEIRMNKVEVKRIGKLFKSSNNSALEIIRIVNGKTTDLDDDAFSSLIDLMHIEVSKAMIKTLKRSMFPARSVLTYFNFRGNLIKSLPKYMFYRMPYLTRVVLDDNRLTTLPDIYSPVYRQFRGRLLFNNNPVVCDCSLEWMYPVAYSSIIEGACAEPPSEKGKSISSLSIRYFDHCNELALTAQMETDV